MTMGGRTALITGGAGGIGQAIATGFRGAGARVVVADLDEERLDRLAHAFPDVKTVVADVSSAEGVARAVAAAGSVDILSHNVGIGDGGATVDELDESRWRAILDVNLTSAFLLTKSVLPSMLAGGRGVVLLMSSVAGLRGGRTGVGYTATKWALVGMAQNIAATLGPEGIRAHAICPGVVATGTTALSTGMPPTARALKRRGRDTGQPSPAQPEDVAELTVFLASDRARHLNGLAVPVDGGWLAY